MISRRTHELRIVAAGDDLGFELPPEIIERHQLREGDGVYLCWTSAGLTLRFTPPARQLSDTDSEADESR